MEQYDHISIGIIMKNEAEHIQHTLAYLLKQSYPTEYMEIILVDGNSTDNTKEKANELLKKHTIPYQILCETDFEDTKGCGYGHSRARNVIIHNTNSKSKYIAWIDADCRVTSDWLEGLRKTIKGSSNTKIAGAGGARYVEKTGNNITTQELVLNYYFTSAIISLGNPAFTKRKVKYAESLAGYNSIYKKEILEKYNYNSVYPFNTDDLELNYRLKKIGYKFLYSPEAVIYHRGEKTLQGFLKQMYMYGTGIANTMKLHKSFDVRIYIRFALFFTAYVILTPLLLVFSGLFLQDYWYLPLFPYILPLLLGVAVFIENYSKTKSRKSLQVIYLIPLHLWSYAWGWIDTYRLGKPWMKKVMFG